MPTKPELYLLLLATALSAVAHAADDPLVERGRYLVKIAGCNDCHTAGYTQANGAVPESEWLAGDTLGWQGPWGTTYATNLRVYVQSLDESQWLQRTGTAGSRPPMPWFNLHAMSEQDRRALYRYIRALGPAGAPAPAYVPPDRTPAGPVVRFPAPPGD
jgi:mono/diheme cytochrome c family protein